MTTKELLMKYENQWVFLSIEQIDFMLNENLPPLPKQEISDEEIEKVAEEWQEFRHGAGKQSFEKGAKWYREQLKQRQ